MDNPGTSKVVSFKIWVIRFCENTIGVENKDPRVYV